MTSHSNRRPTTAGALPAAAAMLAVMACFPPSAEAGQNDADNAKAAQKTGGSPGAQAGRTKRADGVIPAPPTLSERVDLAEQKLTDLANLLGFINKEYVVPQSKPDVQHFEKRVSTAEVLITLKDLASAAVILFELVEDPDNKSRPAYHDAMALLADTLFVEKNYFSAREYYKRLLQDGGSKHFRSSLKRLIEIASITGSYEGLETYYSLAKQLDTSMLSADVYFVLGKSLYLRGDVTRSMETFQQVTEGSANHLKARYFVATILVRKKKYDEALSMFGEITRAKPAKEDDRFVVDLSFMAMGRLLFEQGKFTEAADTYQRVDRKSRMFEQSVYEVAWIYVKRKEYEKAIQALDIMIMSTSEDQVIVQARVLRGNLLLVNGRYEEAEEAFEGVIQQFDPIKEGVRALIEGQDDPVGYFMKMAGEGLDKVEAQKSVPPVAIHWASSEGDVSKAFGVVQELESSRKAIDDSFKVINKLLANLDSENRINMFPVLKEAMIRGLKVKSDLDSLRREFASLEDEAVGGALTGLELEELKSARKNRETIERQIENLPKTEEALQKRTTGYAEKMNSLERSLFNVGLDIDAIKAQLTAIGKWYYDSKERRIDDPIEEEIFHIKLTQEWEEVNTLAVQLKGQVAEVDREKAAMGLVSDMARDERLRDQYRTALDNERRLMEKARAKLGGEATRLAERIAKAYERSKNLTADLAKFELNLDKVVAVKAVELKDRVLVEKKILDGYFSESSGIRNETENVVGRIAFNGFRQVHRKMYDLVLQADVGIIDATWKKKEDESKSIVKLQTDLDKEMRAISDEFEELAK